MKASTSGSGSAASAISRGRLSSSVSSIAPPFLADQRHEPDLAEAFLLQDSVLLLGHFDQFLHRTGIADRHDEPSAGRKLLDQRTWDMAPAGGGEDRVERRLIAATGGPVAFDNLDVAVTEPPQPLARDVDQIMLALDPDHLRGNAADHRRGVTRAGADLEHDVAVPDPGGLDHQRHDIRLRYRLPGLDRQRMIVIGPLLVHLVDERFTRDRAERLEDRRIADSARGDLPLDHPLAKAGEVCHGLGHGPPPDRDENP